MPILAIDFGTTTTVAAVSAEGSPIRLVAIDGSPLMPSSVFLTETGTLTVGRDADRQARLDPSRYEPNPKRRIDDGEVMLGVSALPVGPDSKGPGTLLITDSLAVFKGTGVEDQSIDLGKWLTSPVNQFAYESAHGETPMRPVDGVAAMVKADPSWQPFLDGIKDGGPEPLFLGRRSCVVYFTSINSTMKTPFI